MEAWARWANGQENRGGPKGLLLVRCGRVGCAANNIMITTHQVKLVQSSWDLVAPIAPQAAELFYGRLFELDPSLRELFKADLKDQGKKLMQMLGMVVRGLTNLERLLPTVQDLGKRHGNYGVADSHYDTVGAALLWTLEQGLGKNLTSEVREAWTAAYVMLASTMKAAAGPGVSMAAARV